MNKQALAFMSMFTLVLMLSIYYVSLDETINNKPTEIVSDVTSVMSMMIEKNHEETESTLLQLKEQLGSSQITEEKKKEILMNIENIEDNKKRIEKITEVLTNNQIKSVVQIEKDIVHINIFEVEKSDKKAEEIMKMIYSHIKSNQTIELIFS